MEELIKRLERVIATGAPDKDGLHPISAETVLEVVKELSEHGTDCISRQQAIYAVSEALATGGQPIKALEQLPTIQPDNGLQKLADEIASFKRRVKSDNSDYLTGYLSALSVVEGMIADMREVTT